MLIKPFGVIIMTETDTYNNNKNKCARLVLNQINYILIFTVYTFTYYTFQ